MGFVLNFLISVLVEFTVLLLLFYFMRFIKLNKRSIIDLFMIVIALNAITQPFFIHVMSLFNFYYGYYLIFGEIMVFLSEGFILYYLYRQKLSFLIYSSFFANFFSWQFTLLIAYFLI